MHIHHNESFPEPHPLSQARLAVRQDCVAYTASYIALRQSIALAFDLRSTRYDWARLCGMSPATLSRALSPATGNSTQFARLAGVCGYVPHPSRGDWYRRDDVVDPIAPNLDDDTLDPQLRAELELARWERQTQEASRCPSDGDGDVRDDDWLSYESAASSLAEVRTELDRAEWEEQQDLAWANYEALLAPGEGPGHPSNSPR